MSAVPPTLPKRSMRAAINAFCRQCICDSTQPGTWRMQVERCTSVSCPLYQFRPVSAAGEEIDSPATEGQGEAA